LGKLRFVLECGLALLSGHPLGLRVGL
jgi:hypothetical protein